MFKRNQSGNIGSSGQQRRRCRLQTVIKCAIMGCFVVWILVVLKSHQAVSKLHGYDQNSSPSSVHQILKNSTTTSASATATGADEGITGKLVPPSVTKSSFSSSRTKSPVWDEVLNRAKSKQAYCKAEDSAFAGFDTRFEMTFGKDNNTLATLPAFGIIDALETFNFEQNGDKWQCQLPPELECDETQMTAIFMAYNPDRIDKMFKEIRNLLNPTTFHGLIKECIIVWNGPRSIDESQQGKTLLKFAETNALRIAYPLKMGFPNDLMNRYHPDVVQVTTKAILYYDDDGPFYSYKAVEAGFELWKRHSRQQMGAMSRNIIYDQRQLQERTTNFGANPNDHEFVSHCENLNDELKYNFYYFANYDANMVLPSGSMLHSNYLCFLWHPALEEIRNFVLQHPVHPDDVTVSTVVSHLAGRAPRVYSRRLNGLGPNKDQAVPHEEQRKRRRLAEDLQQAQQPKNQKGMGGICWDCGAGMTDAKRIWADLRGQAINTLIRYFGSINTGSIGWCDEDSQYYNPKKDGKCHPVMAKVGWLSWMNPDGTTKTTCP